MEFKSSKKPDTLHLPVATGSEVRKLDLHGMLFVIELVLAQSEVAAERLLLFLTTSKFAQQTCMEA